MQKWHCATGVHGHGHCIADWFRQVRTSLDKSEHVWSAIFPQPWVVRCPNLAHPQTCVQFLTVPRSKLYDPLKWWNRHASIGVRCELVWSATFLGSTSKSDTTIERSHLAEFGCEIWHSNSANWELCNNVRLVKLHRRKVALHTSSHLTPIEAWRRAVSTTSDK